MRSMLVAFLAALALQAFGADPPAEKENWFKRAGKSIGEDAKAGWKQAKKGYSKGGKQIGQGTANATKKTGRDMKASAKRTGKAAKEEFK